MGEVLHPGETLTVEDQHPRPSERAVVGSNLGTTPIPSELSRVGSSNGSRRSCASHWGNRLANECYFREAPHAASAQPPRPSRRVSYPIGMLTHPAETGVRAILADETMDDPKMESRILLSVVASHRQFEYLERSRRGCGPLPVKGLYQVSALEPSWSMLAVERQHMHLDSRPKLPMSSVNQALLTCIPVCTRGLD
jgi:hypothetical protein